MNSALQAAATMQAGDSSDLLDVIATFEKDSKTKSPSALDTLAKALTERFSNQTATPAILEKIARARRMMSGPGVKDPNLDILADLTALASTLEKEERTGGRRRRGKKTARTMGGRRTRRKTRRGGTIEASRLNRVEALQKGSTEFRKQKEGEDAQKELTDAAGTLAEEKFARGAEVRDRFSSPAALKAHAATLDEQIKSKQRTIREVGPSRRRKELKEQRDTLQDERAALGPGLGEGVGGRKLKRSVKTRRRQ